MAGGSLLRVLGIVSETHDTGVALVNNGVPEIVLEEERFSRVKRTKSFPSRSLHAAFNDRGLSLADVDVIALPWDTRRLRRFAAKAVLRRVPASLNLMHARSHTPQRNQILLLDRYVAKGHHQLER